MFQAITNNIFGTYNVALVAQQFGADNFVMISSDKAVNPTNMMGVTKRLAELIILGLHQHSRTRFMAVRFGNVLGSNGSVMPNLRTADRQWRPGHRYSSRCHPLFHDHSRGRATGAAGVQPG